MASAIVLNLLRTRPDVWFEVALPHQPPSESPASPKRGFRFACGRLSKIGSATIPRSGRVDLAPGNRSLVAVTAGLLRAPYRPYRLAALIRDHHGKLPRCQHHCGCADQPVRRFPLFRSQHVTLQVHTHKLRNSSPFPSPVRRISLPRSLTTTWDTRQDWCPKSRCKLSSHTRCPERGLCAQTGATPFDSWSSWGLEGQR